MAVLRETRYIMNMHSVVNIIRILVYADYYCLDNYAVDCYMLLILVDCCMFDVCSSPNI